MEVEQRKKVVHKYLENPEASQRKIAKELKIAPSTVWNILKRYKETLSVDRAVSSFTYRPKGDPKLTKKIVCDVKRNPGLSVRKRARKLDTTPSVIQRTLKAQGYKSFNVVKVPNRSDKQCKTVKTRVRLLYDKLLRGYSGCILMDDENYMYSDTAQLKVKGHYYAKTRLDVDDKYKYQCLEKFPEKYLIWQGICSCGLKTDAFVTKGTINGELYLEECLKKRLLPLIRKHRAPLLFWPDLATAHYCKRVLGGSKAKDSNTSPNDTTHPIAQSSGPSSIFGPL